MRALFHRWWIWIQSTVQIPYDCDLFLRSLDNFRSNFALYSSKKKEIFPQINTLGKNFVRECAPKWALVTLKYWLYLNNASTLWNFCCFAIGVVK